MTTQKRTRKDLIANIERITKDGNRWGDITLGEIIGLRADVITLQRHRGRGCTNVRVFSVWVKVK